MEVSKGENTRCDVFGPTSDVNEIKVDVIFHAVRKTSFHLLLFFQARLGSILQVNPTPLVAIGGIEEEALGLGINKMKTLLSIFSPFLL